MPATFGGYRLVLFGYKIKAEEEILPPDPFCGLDGMFFCHQLFGVGEAVVDRQVVPYVLNAICQHVEVVLFEQFVPVFEAADVFVAYQNVFLQLFVPDGDNALIAPVFV